MNNLGVKSHLTHFQVTNFKAKISELNFGINYEIG